jgi:hypothetical protein
MANNDSKTADAVSFTAADFIAALKAIQEGNAAALSEGLAAAIKASQPPPVKGFAEIAAEYEAQQPKVDIKVTHHDLPINFRGVSDDTIKHLRNLKPGKYLNGLVEVVYRDDGTLNIASPTAADKNRRTDFYSKVGNFSDMVSKIAAEQKARSTNE